MSATNGHPEPKLTDPYWHAYLGATIAHNLRHVPDAHTRQDLAEALNQYLDSGMLAPAHAEGIRKVAYGAR